MVPVGELLKDAAAFAEALPGDHPLLAEDAADGGMWTAPYRIGRVLRNPLSNAAKYSPGGAPVEVRAAPGETPGYVRVEVADKGVGIHPDDVVRVFEKFGWGGIDPAGRPLVCGRTATSAGASCKPTATT